MLETTQDMEFIMPIMLVIIVSKWVGDYFNISIYDIHVELRCIPFVEYTPSGNLYGLQAAAIMHQPVVQLKVTNTVEELVEVLKSCTHNGFPVVTDESPHRLIGMILRSQIIVLINKRAFGTPDIATGTFVCNRTHAWMFGRFVRFT